MTWNGRELEIKFSADTAGLAAAWASDLLAGSASSPPSQTLSSVYFDTCQGDLKKKDLTLRIRRAGRGPYVMGLKWRKPLAEGLFARGEAEVKCFVTHPNIELFEKSIASELKTLIGDRPLQAQFETRFKRRIRNVTAGTALIEAAFDEGEIVAGARRAKITELELELKAGEPFDLYDFAGRLVEALPLHLEMISKSKRGFMMARGERPLPVKALEPRLAPGTSLDDAISIIIAETSAHFLANWASLRDDVHPESIHQMRVALRRMRALLALFNREIPCAEFPALRAAAKRIATDLGPARACDAFAGLVADGPARHFDEPELFAALDSAINGQRLKLHEQARVTINAPGCTRFVMRIQSLLARRSWRDTLTSDQLSQLTRSAPVFAADALDRLRKRALRRGKDLMRLSDEQRHEVRIALKNLRYAAEYFGGLFAELDEVRRYVRSVARLQDLLGAHNDAASAKAFVKDIRAADSAETALAAGIVLGWFGGGASRADGDLDQAWKAFKGAEPFWR